MNNPLSGLVCEACGEVNWKLGEWHVDAEGLYALAACRNTHLRAPALHKIYVKNVALWGQRLARQAGS